MAQDYPPQHRIPDGFNRALSGVLESTRDLKLYGIETECNAVRRLSEDNPGYGFLVEFKISYDGHEALESDDSYQGDPEKIATANQLIQALTARYKKQGYIGHSSLDRGAQLLSEGPLLVLTEKRGWFNFIRPLTVKDIEKIHDDLTKLSKECEEGKKPLGKDIPIPSGQIRPRTMEIRQPNPADQYRSLRTFLGTMGLAMSGPPEESFVEGIDRRILCGEIWALVKTYFPAEVNVSQAQHDLFKTAIAEALQTARDKKEIKSVDWDNVGRLAGDLAEECFPVGSTPKVSTILSYDSYHSMQTQLANLLGTDPPDRESPTHARK